KFVLVASSVPIALLVNIIRITLTGALSELVSDKVAHVFFHDVAGGLMPPLAPGVLWLGWEGLGQLLVEGARPRPARPQGRARAGAPRGATPPPPPPPRPPRRAAPPRPALPAPPRAPAKRPDPASPPRRGSPPGRRAAPHRPRPPRPASRQLPRHPERRRRPSTPRPRAHPLELNPWRAGGLV